MNHLDEFKAKISYMYVHKKPHSGNLGFVHLFTLYHTKSYPG